MAAQCPYLALFCHRQARCGGGHTDLLDIPRRWIGVDDDELALMTEHEMHFPGPLGGTSTRMSAGMATATVVRFSYNLLTTADYDPALVADNHSQAAAWRGRPRPWLAGSATCSRELRTSRADPDGSLLIWDNQRMLHARSEYHDRSRHLTRFWSTDWRRPMTTDDLSLRIPHRRTGAPAGTALVRSDRHCRERDHPVALRTTGTGATVKRGEPDIDALFEADRPDYPERIVPFRDHPTWQALPDRVALAAAELGLDRLQPAHGARRAAYRQPGLRARDGG